MKVNEQSSTLLLLLWSGSETRAFWWLWPAGFARTAVPLLHIHSDTINFCFVLGFFFPAQGIFFAHGFGVDLKDFTAKE